MHVSVVVCTYTMDRYDDFSEAVESVLRQTHDPIEVVLVSDGNPVVAEHMTADFGHHDAVRVHCTDENRGISYARTRGAEVATGELVAFLDDDAIATYDWIETLVETYSSTDAYAVGGRLDPQWLAGKPSFLPEEFYWLIGVTYRGFPDEVTEVRNTFASNITFDREVFDRLGGFIPNVGPKGDSLLQSAETEFCVQLRNKTGKGVLYNPDAQVGHKIFQFRTNPIFLLRRAFWQGVSKYGIRKYVEASLDTESEFITTLLFCSIPERINMLIQGDCWRGFSQLSFLILATIAVAGGYLYGLLRFTLQLKGE
jgi:GT2 family glycosyltransferase